MLDELRGCAATFDGLIQPETKLVIRNVEVLPSFEVVTKRTDLGYVRNNRTLAVVTWAISC
jgi:hypothetical protein